VSPALRAVLVGAGGIGSSYSDTRSGAPRSHASGLLAHPDVRLVGAIDTDGRQRERFHSERGLPAWAPSGAHRAGKVDIAVVATPPDAHSSGLDLALALGARAVLMEKPMGRTAAEAASIAARAAEAGTSLLVNYSRRFDPAFDRLRERVQAGCIGLVRRITVDYCRGLRNNGSHAIDLSDQTLGPLEVEMAVDRIAEGGDDPSLDVWLRSRHGVPIDLIAMPAGSYHTFVVNIVGSTGVLRAEGATAWLRKGSGDALTPLGPPRAIVRRLSEGAIKGAIADLVSAARSESLPRCGPDHALSVWAALERAASLTRR